MAEVSLQSVVAALQDRVLVYVGGDVGYSEVLGMARHSPGVVLRGRRAVSAARRLRDANYGGALLIDPAAYERPAEADGLFDARGQWFDVQRQAGAHVHLTPSRYIADGDRRALGATLDEAREAPLGAALVLPLGSAWLSRHSNVLAHAVMGYDGPIALVLAHPDNPLESADAIRGLVALIGVVQGLILLRSDVAVLGAIAHGALAGAIGTGSAVRHFVPPGRNAGGTRGDPTPNVFVPRLLHFVRGSKLESVQGADRHGVLECRCVVCDGRSLERFGDERLVREARLHSVLAWSLEADRLTATPPVARPALWRGMCEEALDGFGMLEADTGGNPFPPPPSLRGWLRLPT